LDFLYSQDLVLVTSLAWIGLVRKGGGRRKGGGEGRGMREVVERKGSCFTISKLLFFLCFQEVYFRPKGGLKIKNVFISKHVFFI